MLQVAIGRFTVEMTPTAEPQVADGVSLGRLALRKVFTGDLEGTGDGEMLTARTPVDGSAGYVAIERVVGTLHGRVGSFVMQHSGTMDRGAPQLSISVVPDTGTGALVGITGTFHLEVVDGVHRYRLHYTLPGAG